MTIIIDGTALAKQLRQQVAQQVAVLQAQINVGLAVIQVGNNASSTIYVRNKIKFCQEVGIVSRKLHLPEDTPQDELVEKIQQLNQDKAIHGILLQLPLPNHLDSAMILDYIAPEKDVDGLTTLNSGHLAKGNFSHCFIPCTPLGVLKLLRHLEQRLATSFIGSKVVILGRSAIVGRPLAHLLLHHNFSVTQLHSHSKNVQQEVESANIVIAALGKANFIPASWLKPEAIVLDVGINRLPLGHKPTITGDVDFQAASKLVAAITPVPGGVGPMTIACLLANTLLAACRSHNLPYEST